MNGLLSPGTRVRATLDIRYGNGPWILKGSEGIIDQAIDDDRFYIRWASDPSHIRATPCDWFEVIDMRDRLGNNA